MIKSQRKIENADSVFYEITLKDGSCLELAQSIPNVPFEEKKTPKIIKRVIK